MIRFLIMITSLIFIFTEVLGCDMNKIAVTSFEGTWAMTDSSREFLPTDLQGAAAKIVLNPDKTFTASDIPGLLFIAPGKIKLDSGSGVWSLITFNNRDLIQLEFQTITGDNKGQVAVPYGAQLFYSKWFSTLTLYYFIDDPDLGNKIEFKKGNGT